ncbi:hypothetical protein ACH9EU_13390 [Kocuria sp. M1R5S2]|uniref:hypothetical protein n=1 Tax=Kocuria rhizosphaerae TaxID=3376285 RepID=UPI0037ACD06E
MLPAHADGSFEDRRARPVRPPAPARTNPVPVQATVGNRATTSLLSTGRTGGPAVRRAADPLPLQRSADQAKDMQARAWLVRGFQAIRALLGLQGDLDFVMGVDTLKQPIRAHHIPGQIADVALVIAGVHGSEQSGVEVADRLLAQLRVHKPFFTVVIVPRLFPDNVASRAAWEAKLAKDQGTITLKKYRELRNKAGDPHRSTTGQVDPNRQFPAPGADLDLDKPVDAKGRPVEPGNLALMALITAFSPQRLISIHAQKDLDKAGVFSDPQASVAPGPLATETDRLAIEAAKRAEALGARVAGNKRGTTFSSLYPGQDPKTAKEQMKRENAKGHSLGQWGPSQGIGVFTVEVAEQYTSTGAVGDPHRAAELEAHATALREVLLGPPAVPAGPGGAGTPAQGAAGAPPAPVQRAGPPGTAVPAAVERVHPHSWTGERDDRLEHGTVGTASAVRAADRSAQVRLTVAGLTALQRAVGNAAVAEHVAEHVAQRQPAPPDLDLTEFIEDTASPGLTLAVATRIRDALTANRRQQALNLLVDALVEDGTINRALLRGGRMRYDAGLAGEGAATVPRFRLVEGRRVANPTRVRLGPNAFRRGLPLLYSSVLHEYRHVEQFQRINSAEDPLSGQNDWLEHRQEVDAYLHEIENSRTTGMFADPRQMREAWRRLHFEHWIDVDRAGRRALNDRYVAAHAIVREAVGPDVRLGFSPL